MINENIKVIIKSMINVKITNPSLKYRSKKNLDIFNFTNQKITYIEIKNILLMKIIQT